MVLTPHATAKTDGLALPAPFAIKSRKLHHQQSLQILAHIPVEDVGRRFGNTNVVIGAPFVDAIVVVAFGDDIAKVGIAPREPIVPARSVVHLAHEYVLFDQPLRRCGNVVAMNTIQIIVVVIVISCVINERDDWPSKVGRPVPAKRYPAAKHDQAQIFCRRPWTVFFQGFNHRQPLDAAKHVSAGDVIVVIADDFPIVYRGLPAPVVGRHDDGEF